MRVCCISDLHGYYPTLEEGDLLIIAGDFCKDAKSSSDQLEFISWMKNQPYKKVIFVGGNHDTWLENLVHNFECLYKVTYLYDSGTEFEGFKIYGTPWTRKFQGMNPKCMAFTEDYDHELSEHWNGITSDVDILVTHCPPYGMFDSVAGEPVGSQSLLLKILDVKPMLHVFGHIHEEGGKSCTLTWQDRSSIFVNASHVDFQYQPRNKPFYIDLELPLVP